MRKRERERSYVRQMMVVATTALVAGCGRSIAPPGVVTPAAQSPAGAALLPNVRDVPALNVSLPPSPRPWDVSDSALVAEVRKWDGQVFIGLKEPGSLRMFETARWEQSVERDSAQVWMGTRAAVRASTIKEALRALKAQGVEIIEYYDAIGGVFAKIDPNAAPQLRRNQFVDYLEPLGAPGTTGAVTPISGRPVPPL